jgi:ribosomal protein L12E/L44/L45/RPP1/RPP2
MVRLTMDRERMKYLFKEVLGVDVDDVVRKVVATIAIERAKQAQENTKDWKRYMEAEGGIVILPSTVTQLGRKEPKQ